EFGFGLASRYKLTALLGTFVLLDVSIIIYLFLKLLRRDIDYFISLSSSSSGIIVIGLPLRIKPSGSSPSVLATTIVTAASPVIFTTVRHISRILSGANINAIPATGTPIASNTIISITTPAPGTPADPIDAKVAVKIM